MVLQWERTMDVQIYYHKYTVWFKYGYIIYVYTVWFKYGYTIMCTLYDFDMDTLFCVHCMILIWIYYYVYTVCFWYEYIICTPYDLGMDILCLHCMIFVLIYYFV